MNRRLLSLSTLIIAILALVLASCSGGTNNNAKSSPGAVTTPKVTTSTTESTTTTAPQEPKHSDNIDSTSFTSVFNKFSAWFPVFEDTGVEGQVISFDMPADSKSTGYTGYSTSIVAAEKNGKTVYCRSTSKACRLFASFSVDVYIDTPLNREALRPASYEDCRDTSVTGIPARDCKWRNDQYSTGYGRELTVYHNGRIFYVNANGKINEEYLYERFFNGFGLEID